MRRNAKRLEDLVARYCREEPLSPQERAEVEAHLMDEENEPCGMDVSKLPMAVMVEPPRRMPNGPRCQRN